jgi:O-antigen/teichoic acid export membrane protein
VTTEAGVVAPGFARAAASTLGYRLSTAIMSFVSVLITARALGPTERGQLALLIAIAAISAQLGRFAVEEANANLAAGEPETRRGLATNSLVFSCVFGAVCALVIVLLFEFVPAAHGDTPPATWWLAIGTIPVLMLQAYLTYLVRADYAFRVTNVSWLMGPAIAMAGNAILWAAGELTVTTAFASWIVAHSAACLLLVGYVVRRSVGFGRPDRRLARRTMRFGLKAYVGRVLLVGNYRLDQWILAGIAGPRELGLYSIAVAWAEVLFYLPTVLMIVQRPYLVRASEGDAARRSAIAFRVGVLCTVPAALAMILAAPLLCTTVFGDAFSGAIGDLRLLALGAFGIVALQQLGDALTARGAPLRSSAAIGVAFVTTIGLDLLLIPELGGAGAALASTLAYTAGGAAIIVLYLRYFDVSARELLPRPAELAAYARGLGRASKENGL